MNNNFPKEIYVILDESGDDPFLVAHADAIELGSPNSVAPMARYVLAGTGEIVNESKYTETEE